MPVQLTQTNLEGIIECIKGINEVYRKGHTGKAFMEWPEKFPVVADDGYSLGDIIFEDEWVFVPQADEPEPVRKAWSSVPLPPQFN